MSAPSRSTITRASNQPSTIFSISAIPGSGFSRCGRRVGQSSGDWLAFTAAVRGAESSRRTAQARRDRAARHVSDRLPRCLVRRIRADPTHYCPVSTVRDGEGGRGHLLRERGLIPADSPGHRRPRARRPRAFVDCLTLSMSGPGFPRLSHRRDRLSSGDPGPSRPACARHPFSRPSSG